MKGDVLVRLSSLSSDRYARLLGGDRYEPKPGDPHHELRGAARHCHPVFGRAFSVECQAIRRVREEMGLSNVNLIAPLCRTPEEGRRLLSALARHRLVQGENGLQVYLQVQTPSNLFLIEQFGRLFDGFMVQAEDLLALVVGAGGIGPEQGLFTEGAAAARRFCRELLQGARQLRPQRRVGFCARDPEAIPSWVADFAGMGVDFVVTRPNKLATTKLIVAYAELARQERKHLVVVGADLATGRETLHLGVPPGWLKDRAKRWSRDLAGQVRELPAESRKAVAAFLGAMSPRVQVERPGDERDLFCWRAEEGDVAREKRAKGVRSPKVQSVGSLDVPGLAEVAHVWSKQIQAAGRRAPVASTAKVSGLIRRFENARGEYLANTFTAVVTELFSRESQRS